MVRTIKRILIYTHNSIGIGHAFRTLAVITGIRYHRPEIDFLVVSGTSIPQIFLDEGIEVLKLPGIKKDVETPGSRLKPRHLTTLGTSALMELRQRLIMDTLDCFSPDVVMVEHYMGGLMSEAMPLIRRKRAHAGRLDDFALIHFSRGIFGGLDHLSSCGKSDQGFDVVSIARHFDFIYILEDPENVDFNGEVLGGAPDLQHRIHYLGRITGKTAHELLPRAEVLRRFGLVDRPIVLVTLGRHGPILPMTRKLMWLVASGRFGQDHQMVFVIDPYLDREIVKTLRKEQASGDVRFLPFTPHLVDLVNIANLVICRAGYNIVNEVLMTGAPALVIPEPHPSGEQERRARSIRERNIVVASEKEVLEGQVSDTLADFLSRSKASPGYDFDKYAIGRRMVNDLDHWMNKGRPVESQMKSLSENYSLELIQVIS